MSKKINKLKGKEMKTIKEIKNDKQKLERAIEDLINDFSKNNKDISIEKIDVEVPSFLMAGVGMGTVTSGATCTIELSI